MVARNFRVEPVWVPDFICDRNAQSTWFVKNTAEMELKLDTTREILAAH